MSASVRISTDLTDRLDRLSKATARPKSKLVAEAIACYVESQEAQLQSTRRGLADMKAGRLISGTEVEKWLDSWGTKNEIPLPRCK
jgi:predicted transcriptional regulator